MRQKLSLALATGCFVGFVPGAPGTYASVLTSLIFYLVYLQNYHIVPELHLSVLGLVTVLGVLSSDVVSRRYGLRDPSCIVIDEVAGQLAALLLVPVNLTNVLVSTVLFRTIDIWKPFGIKRLESLGRGVGILADDLAAGFLACILLHAGIRLLSR